ncbi:hypothetical protein BGX26_003051, partial [Mortierella sp. AD094]
EHHRALIAVGDGNTPEDELVCNNVVKVRTLLGLDEVFEVIDSVDRGNLALDVASPSTRQNRLRRLSVM